jgi:hypothetical protein
MHHANLGHGLIEQHRQIARLSPIGEAGGAGRRLMCLVTLPAPRV